MYASNFQLMSDVPDAHLDGLTEPHTHQLQMRASTPTLLKPSETALISESIKEFDFTTMIKTLLTLLRKNIIF